MYINTQINDIAIILNYVYCMQPCVHVFGGCGQKTFFVKNNIITGMSEIL